MIEFKGDKVGANDFNFGRDVLLLGAGGSWANNITYRAVCYDGEWYLLENA